MALLKSKPLMWAIVVMTQSYATDRSHLHFFQKKNPLNAITHLLCFISHLLTPSPYQVLPYMPLC